MNSVNSNVVDGLRWLDI